MNEDLPSKFDMKFAVMQLLNHTGDLEVVKGFYDWLMEDYAEDTPVKVKTEGSVVQLDFFDK